MRRRMIFAPAVICIAVGLLSTVGWSKRISQGEKDALTKSIALIAPATVQIACRTSPRVPRPLGTGFVVAPDGSVITMYHVVHACAVALGLKDTDLQTGKRFL